MGETQEYQGNEQNIGKHQYYWRKGYYLGETQEYG